MKLLELRRISGFGTGTQHLCWVSGSGAWRLSCFGLPMVRSSCPTFQHVQCPGQEFGSGSVTVSDKGSVSDLPYQAKQSPEPPLPDLQTCGSRLRIFRVHRTSTNPRCSRLGYSCPRCKVGIKPADQYLREPWRHPCQADDFYRARKFGVWAVLHCCILPSFLGLLLATSSLVSLLLRRGCLCCCLCHLS